jgi:anti-sigma factor RsiW
MTRDGEAHPALTERYLLGELSESERAAFEAHAFECPACAEDLLAGEAFVQNARLALAQPRPAPAPAPGWFRRWFAGGGLAALGLRVAAAGALPLLALAGYQGLHVIPQLHEEVALRDTPRALAPLTLRGATRGEAPAVVLTPADRALALQLDLPAAGEAPLQAEVQDAAGRTIMKIDAPAPPPGEPLLVSLPSAALPDGSYQLVIRATATEIGRYPFAVKRR